MYNQDIRRNITNKSKDKGVKNLIAICSVDKLSKEICSSIDFWGPIFEEYEFYLPQIIPSTHTAWISTFESEKLLKRDIDEVITFLDTKEGYATVQSVGFPCAEIFGSIKDIDKNELLIMDNDKKILKHLRPIYRYPSIFITNKGDDIYRLVINYRQVNSIKVNITRKEMRYILHKLLFHEINVSPHLYDNQ